MNYCLYGTVYNNVNYVEDSVKSFFSPIYDKIVIVDSYSTDGTYEKLKEMEKDYNLTILRLKSSRGKGRDYALRHCPEGSFTAYVDLDATYNKNLEKAIELEIDKSIFGAPQYTITAKRETILNKGGWKDFLVGEDNELFCRLGINIYLPVVIGINPPYRGIREYRYTKTLIQKYLRRFRLNLDLYRSGLWNFNFHFDKYLPISTLIYLIALLKGRTQYNKEIDNGTLSYYILFSNLKDPLDFGFEKDFIATYVFNHAVKIYERKFHFNVLSEISSKLPYLKKHTISLKSDYINVFYYDEEILKYIELFFVNRDSK